jgi:hypothetical protein
MCGEPECSNAGGQDHSQRYRWQASLVDPTLSLLIFVHLFLFLFFVLTMSRSHYARS